MKNKVIIAAIAAMVAGVSCADISVAFKNSSGLLKPGFPSGTPSASAVLDAGVFVQLLWKADNSGYQSDDLDVSLLNSGESLLGSGLAGSTWGRFDYGSIVAGDAFVGGADINNGYFYARVFEDAAPTVGSYFVEMGIKGPVLKEYTVIDVTSIYSDSLNDLGAWISVDTQGTQVIPEPATFGLMGVAGVGMFLARRKTRR